MLILEWPNLEDVTLRSAPAASMSDACVWRSPWNVMSNRYVWHSDYTAEQYIALLDTFSGHIVMKREKRDFLYAEIRKRISRRLDRKIGVTGSPSFVSRLGHKRWGLALRRRGRSPIDMHPEPGARGTAPAGP